MKFRWDKKYLYWGVTAFLVICASIVFYYLMFYSENLRIGLRVLLNITMPVIDGFILAYLMAPLLNFIEKKLFYPIVSQIMKKDSEQFSIKTKKNIRKLGILTTLLIVFWLLYCLFSMLMPQLILSIQNIIFQFPFYIENLNNWVLNLFDSNPEIEATVNTLLNRYSSKVEEWVTGNLLPQMNSLIRMVSSGLIGSLIGVAKAFWNLIIGLIISLYLLDGKERFAGQGKKFVYSLFDIESANVFVSNIRFIHNTFIGFLGGKIIDSIIIGIICYLGTNLIGTPYSVLISVIIGVTNVIPFFGPYLGAIPSAILILMVDPLQCLYFIIFILVLQQFDGNVLGPKILGDSTGLNSFWVIFSITFFGGLLGVFGMIIGVPVFAVIYAGIKAATNRRLEDKGLPVDTESYLKVGSIVNEKEFIPYAPASRKEKKEQKKSGKGNVWTLPDRKKRNRSTESCENQNNCEINNKEVDGTEEDSKQ